MELLPGERVDRYLLRRMLGEGGQGAVWEAEDPLEPERPRALKLVMLGRTRPAEVERMRREARALASLDHPSLVKCYGLFEDLRLGVVGLSMDFVDGDSLRRLIHDPRLTPELRVLALGHVARALAYLHGRGIVHRDIKLDNVMVATTFFDAPARADTVKLVDFGIAAVEGNPDPLTALHGVVGTLPYLAPELVDPACFGHHTSSPTADVFAFGVLAWQLLFDGTHPTGLPARATLVDFGLEYRRLAELELRFPAEALGEGWDDLFQSCLAMRPERRLPSGQELAAHFESAARSGAVRRVLGRADRPLAEQPTALAGPAASFAPTVAASAESRRSTPMTASPRSAPSTVASPAPPAPRSRGALVATLTLAAITLGGAAGSAWLLLGSGGGERRAPTAAPSAWASRSTPDATERSVAPLATAPSDAELGGAGDAAGEAASPWLPLDCADRTSLCACCPSGVDCGGDCEALLPPDTRITLRLADVKSNGASLFAKHPGLEVSVGAPDVSPAMTPPADGGAPLLAMSVADLTHGGLVVRLTDGEQILAERSRAVYRAGIARSALCHGLVVTGFAGSVRVDEARFYLEPLDQAPERCPR